MRKRSRDLLLLGLHFYYVTDTGAGMDEETLMHAIEPFYTTKGVGKGTGLGLPMVHGMAEQSGGKLILKSKPGEGTTVELCLPISVSGDESPADAPVRSEAPRTRALTIVSVDDDPLVAFNTSAMLEDLGHTVYCAFSGPEALNLLRQHNVNVMPGIDRRRACECRALRISRSAHHHCDRLCGAAGRVW
jgi:hypothetical protein